ncbi:PLAC8-domain-containing protein [Zopfia rhizophila CBS 207.26]|uniref:PLAC8-domain-containing protein n=1 Tax=Zopfia rhizophila CBS 207.26 TaxID=1314779 RepID=A0A6A6DJU1_9PEZI|nr:PLAC8-domain-containing protein [Zopfia rhizophila CBS 207.26]
MSGGLVDQKDINDWKDRFNKAIENKAWSSASSNTAQSWKHSLFECFSPPSLCLVTCCLPCVTFGKTHHRTRKNGNMEGYEPINTSCLLFYLSSCFGVHWALQAMQMQDIRERYNLEGSCVGDIFKACCCGCCALIQAEKESEEHEKGMKGVVNEQYGVGEQMKMGAQH